MASAVEGDDLVVVFLAVEALADATGGRYFQATDTGQLEQVYSELDRLEPSIRDTRSFRPLRPLYVWPAGAALLISIVLASMTWLRRGHIAHRLWRREHSDAA